ncbi:MAG: hypothetical protein ACYDHY_17195 [Acidiferrobacterales bacterium]
MKTLFFSHGNKGGVAKSYTATLATEYLLAHGHQIALVEADASQPDIASRYRDVEGVTLGFLPLNKSGDAENALSDFGAWLESNAPDIVVVNLPAGAGETLDALASSIRDLSDAMGYRLVVTYGLEKNRTAADGLARSLQDGLLSVVAPQDRFVVYPTYKGAPESFEWFHSEDRKSAQIGEIIMPAIGSRSALQKLEQTPGRVSDLIDKSRRPEGWMILDQSSIFRFYHAAMSAIKPVFPEVGE